MKMREEYIIDKFIDYTGTEKTFIMAAISKDTSDILSVAVTNTDREYLAELTNKCLMLGLSVCNPKDEFNEEIGKRIAKGKALNRKSRVSTLYSTDKGLINTSVVKAILKQEAEYLKQNPGNYIKSYNADKEAFEYKEKLEDIYQAMPEDRKNAVNILAEMSDKEITDILEVADSLR